jgi:pyruvate,orthophosphate dikinase
MDQRIFKFSGSTCEWKGDQKKAKAILGGKGAGLVMMAKDGLNVPPGFTLTTDNCNAYLALSPGLRETFMDGLMEEVDANMVWLTAQFGYAPLVSVRSGAAVSMPGMMDTILNVGLVNANFNAWCKRIGDRATFDSDRRLTQMLGATAYGVPMAVFDFQLAKVKKEVGAKSDTDLDVLGLSKVISAYRNAFEENKGFKFPFADAKAQLRAAIKAVFESWMNPRAIEYRKINKLDDKMGTAVTVQAMVFGNMGEDSGTGVLFSRNPSTGEPGMMGEFLTNAQGEDVVAGIRTPVSVAKMADLGPAWSDTRMELVMLCAKLEASYKDMVDVEFTVQNGKLFVLQSRTGKRSARAAFRIATDMEAAGVIDRKTAISRLTVDQFKVVRRPSIDPKFKGKPDFVGLPACPGVVTGKPVFSADDAVKCKEPCILVTHETNPNDIAGMAAAVGILTQTGGATSHAAVVARAMDKACITGCTDLDWPKVKAAKKVTIDGSTGRVWVGVDVPVIDSSNAPEVRKVLDWCQAVLGTCEVAPVDMGMDQPHRVMAAYWWGQQEVLDAVLDGLAELPSREHVALDLRGPNSFAPETDAILLHAFGEPSADKFETVLYAKLTARAEELKGLRLLNVEMDFAHPVVLLSLGFGVDGVDGMQLVPKAAPAEYAAFTVLAR